MFGAFSLRLVQMHQGSLLAMPANEGDDFDFPSHSLDSSSVILLPLRQYVCTSTVKTNQKGFKGNWLAGTLLDSNVDTLLNHNGCEHTCAIYCVEYGCEEGNHTTNDGSPFATWQAAHVIPALAQRRIPFFSRYDQ